MRIMISVAALGLLAACAPPIPDSGAGFDTTLDQAKAQQELLDGVRAGGAVPPPQVVSSETLGPADAGATATAQAPLTATGTSTTSSGTSTGTSTGSADDIAQETAAALAAASQNSGVAPIQASPSNPAPQQVSSAGISDENDFSAVSSRESIASDAARIEQNKSTRQVVAPTALPDRPSDTGPNIVTFALNTSNEPGTRLYSRTGINLQARADRNCSKYPSPDQAQIDFLAKGGPDKDRLGLDPDGDGFACSWDPRPFRRATQG